MNTVNRKPRTISTVEMTLNARLDDTNFFHPRNCVNAKRTKLRLSTCFKLFSTDASIFDISVNDVPDVIKGKYFDKVTGKFHNVTLKVINKLNNAGSVLYRNFNGEFEVKVRNLLKTQPYLV